MRFALIALLTLTLGGCASQLPVRDIQTVSSLTPGAVGTDVYAQRRAAGENVPVFAGENFVTVRTYAGQPTSAGSISRGKEIAGADCKIGTGEYAAQVTTPAKVRVPNYRDRSSPILVECAKEGYLKQAATVAPFNKSRSERANMVSSGAGAGLIGIVVGVAAAGIAEAASDPSTDVFAYADASLVLTPVNAAGTARANARKAAEQTSPFGGS